ncbi:hypothetical protein [Paraburkholderia sp. PGU19]|uniref:hypothetical protein n=1 Tax=Paraburkholderia sp. PGU19 TaxID=2735434 RepID=UPI0015DADD70|nr:hypothetical protein [Paraburkholderia sp. PGU19]
MQTTSHAPTHSPSMAVLQASSFAFMLVEFDVTIVNVAPSAIAFWSRASSVPVKTAS